MTLDSDAELVARYLPIEPGVVADPFPSYAALRRTCPVHQTDGFDVPLRSVARHADVVAMLVDHALWSNANGPGVGTSGEGSVGDMQHDDEPVHQRRRRLALQWFMPSAVRHQEAELRDLAAGLAEQMLQGSRAELYEDFALPMPVSTICSILGITMEDRATWVHWADELTTGMAYPARSEAARRAMSERTAAEVTGRRASAAEGGGAGPGLLGHLATAPWAEDGSPMPVNEVVSMVNQLIVAGHETTTSLVTNCVWRLLSDRERLWERVVAEPALVGAAIEESLRFDPPVLGICRTNREPTTMGGEPLEAGSKVMMLFAAANRDEGMFDEPETFSLDRAPAAQARHLAFGLGVHHCLGSRLARLSGRVAVETLVERFPTLRLDGSTARIPAAFLWGRKQLPVTW